MIIASMSYPNHDGISWGGGTPSCPENGMSAALDGVPLPCKGKRCIGTDAGGNRRRPRSHPFPILRGSVATLFLDNDVGKIEVFSRHISGMGFGAMRCGCLTDPDEGHLMATCSW